MERIDEQGGGSRKKVAMNFDSLYRVCQEEALAFVVGSKPAHSGGMDVTVCYGDDGTQMVMVVMDGRISINGTPIALDKDGFVVSPDGRSLSPIKYQALYRQAVAERKRRLTSELDGISEKKTNWDACTTERKGAGKRELIACRSGGATGERPDESEDIDLRLTREFIHPIETQKLPELVKHLVNELCLRIDDIDSSVQSFLHDSATNDAQVPESRSARRHCPAPSASLCNILRSIHLWRRRRRSRLLLENERSASEEINDDVIVRASSDARSLAQELRKKCYQLSVGYYALRKLLDEADRSNVALVKTVEVFCAETAAREMDLIVCRQYRTLCTKYRTLMLKEKACETKIGELETKNEDLLEQTRALEKKVEDMSSKTTSSNTMSKNVSLQVHLTSSSSLSSLSSSSSLLQCYKPPDRATKLTLHNPTEQNGIQTVEKNTQTIGNGEIKIKGMAFSDLEPTRKKSIPSEEDVVHESPSRTVKERVRLERLQQDPRVTWGDVLKAHEQYWRRSNNLSDQDRRNMSLLHRLRVERDSMNDTNKRLASRLTLSKADSGKLNQQVRELLEEKQRLHDRLSATQTLLKIAQKSMINQSESTDVRRDL